MSRALNTVKIEPIAVLICQVMKITKVNDKIMACPAIMLANKRIINAKVGKYAKEFNQWHYWRDLQPEWYVRPKDFFPVFFITKEVYRQHGAESE